MATLNKKSMIILEISMMAVLELHKKDRCLTVGEDMAGAFSKVWKSNLGAWWLEPRDNFQVKSSAEAPRL